MVDSGFEGESYPVTASHTSDEWLIVSVDGNLLWIAISVGEMIGDCDDLPISDTLLKDADSPTDEPDDDDEPDETDEPDDDDEPDDEEDEPEEPGDD